MHWKIKRSIFPDQGLWLGQQQFWKEKEKKKVKGCNYNWKQLEVPVTDTPKGLLGEHLIDYENEVLLKIFILYLVKLDENNGLSVQWALCNLDFMSPRL